jgi:hypothetical protein
MKTLGRFFYSPDDAGGSASGTTTTSTPPPATGSLLSSQNVSTPSTGGGTPPPPSATPPVVTLTYKDGIISEDGGLKENWMNVLPENLRAEKSLQNHKTFESLAKSYVMAQKAMGSEKIPLPGKHATPEEVNAFQMKLGRPEKVEGYEYKKPEQLPPGVSWDDNRLNAFKAIAFKNGVSQAQFKELVDGHLGMLAEEAKAFDTQKVNTQAESRKTLETTWGNAFNNKLQDVKRMADMFGGVERFERMGVGDNAEFLMFMADLAGKFGEGTFKGHDAQLVPVDASAKIAEIMGNKSHPYYDKLHPAHDSAVAEVQRLFAMANPQRRS